mgnify:CR=1 FL=1
MYAWLNGYGAKHVLVYSTVICFGNWSLSCVENIFSRLRTFCSHCFQIELFRHFKRDVQLFGLPVRTDCETTTLKKQVLWKFRNSSRSVGSEKRSINWGLKVVDRLGGQQPSKTTFEWNQAADDFRISLFSFTSFCQLLLIF